jgi:ABC-type Fe3+/spermidine/putrescine transport system ATPase subunit
VAIRPEALTLGGDEAAVRAGTNGHGQPLSTFAVRVSDVAFLGDHYQYALAAGGVSLQAQAPAVVSGDELWAGVSCQACTIV